MGQVALDIQSQAAGCFVAAIAVFFQALQDDPIQIAFDGLPQSTGFGPTVLSDCRRQISFQGTDPHTRAQWLLFADDPTQLVIRGRVQAVLVEGCRAAQ